MAKQTMVPNTFVTEEGGLIFINSYEITDEVKEVLEYCGKVCRRLEKKYNGTELTEMILNGIKKKEAHQYLDCKQTLLEWGFE